MEAKFNYGDKVLINGNIVGIVLFSYNNVSSTKIIKRESVDYRTPVRD